MFLSPSGVAIEGGLDHLDFFCFIGRGVVLAIFFVAMVAVELFGKIRHSFFVAASFYHFFGIVGLQYQKGRAIGSQHESYSIG